MTRRRWFEHDLFQLCKTAVLIVIAVVGLGPKIVSDAVNEPSMWHVVVLLALLASVGLLSCTSLRDLGRYRRTGSTKVAQPPRVDPKDIEGSAVDEAIASTTSRILAIKLLREQHPGLGLLDAVNLVDKVLAGPAYE